MEQPAAAPVKLKPLVGSGHSSTTATGKHTKPQQRSRRKNHDSEDDASKRRCVSTACIACRKRKSKCDGNTPACAACSQVYRTECIYDPNSDHRRKGVYKNDVDSLKTRNSTLHILIQAIINYQENDAFDLVREIRACESLDGVAEQVAAKDHGFDLANDYHETTPNGNSAAPDQTFASHLYGKMGDLQLDEGSVRYIGGTSNLLHLDPDDGEDQVDEYPQHENPITSWTRVTDDADLVIHLLNMYFCWHYNYFLILSQTLFYRDFLLGRPPPNTRRKTHFCTSLLLNAMLALGCHFTSHTGARAHGDDSSTAGDHFFNEAKRLIMENDEHEKPRLTTIQALALMSVREAGCAREARGWIYSGMSFRMACDMGLNLNTGQLTNNKHVNGNETEEDVRRITFWGCFLFDKCWSNYLGRLPQLPNSIVTVPKFEVFLDEDSELWSPYTDSGYLHANSQPARTRAVALQISKLCEISSDLMNNFYNPIDLEKNRGKPAELKMLSTIHTRLEAWRRDLPQELEPSEGGLASVLLMHMFFQLLFIHLFRPFLKYTQATSPLPQTVSPRKLCTQAAQMISKLMRLYKRSHGLRQICNIAVYIAHAACTIHMINLPDKNAKRDIVHGVKQLEEIAEGWLCARRTLGILSLLAKKWKVELPEEAITVLSRTDKKFGQYSSDSQSPKPPQRKSETITVMDPSQFMEQQAWQNPTAVPTSGDDTCNGSMPNVFSGALQNGSMVCSSSDGCRLPPYDENGLIAQQQPSAGTTPYGSRQTSTGASPSEMFGNVEQIIRDTEDWTYQDSVGFAAGFENWTVTDMDPTIWANGIPGNDAMSGTTVGGVSDGTSVPTSQPAAYGIDGNFTMNELPAMSWLASYNEGYWYQ